MKIFAFLLHVDLMQAKQEHKKQQKKTHCPGKFTSVSCSSLLLSLRKRCYTFTAAVHTPAEHLMAAMAACVGLTLPCRTQDVFAP